MAWVDDCQTGQDAWKRGVTDRKERLARLGAVPQTSRAPTSRAPTSRTPTSRAFAHGLLSVIEQIPDVKASLTIGGAPIKRPGLIIREYAWQIAKLNRDRTALDICDGARPRPAIRQIIYATALQYGVTPDDILSDRRTKEVVLPRQVAMYLAREFTLRSFPDIGRQIGGRDHTTALHGYRKIFGRLAAGDVELNSNIDAITESLGVAKQ